MQEDDKRLDGAEREVVAALSSLRPKPPQIDRDRLMFDAGYRSAYRKLWLWRGAAGSLAAMLLISVFIRPELPAITPTVGGGSGRLAVQTKPAAPSNPPLERVDHHVLELIWSLGTQPYQSPRSQNYLSVRQAVLESGLSALPAPAGDESGWHDLRLFEIRSGQGGDEMLMKRPGGNEL
jgi:hypothetical protein